MEEQTLLGNENTRDNEKEEDNWIQKFKALGVVFLSILATVASATSVQLLKRSIPDFELNTLRFLTSLILVSIVFIFMRKLPMIPRSQILVTLSFSFMTMIETMTLYLAPTFIPLSSSQSLIITSGIVSGIIIFPLLTSDTFSLKNLAFAVLCISGVTLVVQPEFIFSGIHATNDTVETISREESSLTIAICGYGSATFNGVVVSITMVLIKRHPFISEHIAEIIFWTCNTGIFISTLAMVIFEKLTLPHNWNQLLLSTIHCVTFVIGWPSYMYSLQYLQGNTVNIFVSTTVVLMLVSQYAVSSSVLPGNRNWIEIVGVVFVLLGSTLGSILEILKQN